MSLRFEGQVLHGKIGAPLNCVRDAFGLSAFQSAEERIISLGESRTVTFGVEQHLLHSRQQLGISAFVLIEENNGNSAQLISIQEASRQSSHRIVTTASYRRGPLGQFELIGGNVETNFEAGSTEQIIDAILSKNASVEAQTPMHRRDASFTSNQKITLLHVREHKVTNAG